MYELLSKLSLTRGLNVAIIIFGNLVAPYWFIFQFSHSTYVSNTTIQMVILSVAIGIPITFFNYVSLHLAEDLPIAKSATLTSDEANATFYAMAYSSLITACALYAPCIYLGLGDSLTERAAILRATWLEGGTLFYTVVRMISRIRNKRIEGRRLRSTPPA